LAFVGALAVPAFAQAPAKPRASASAAPSLSASSASSARPLSSAEQSGALPSGHPRVDANDDGEDEEMPAGHPNVASQLGVPDQNSSKPDGTIPRGTILAELRDAQGKPIAHQDVILGIVISSIAQGETRKRLSAQTDERGVATFSGLDTASQIAYRVSVQKDGGSFAAPPFQLPQAAGMRATISVFDVVTDVHQVQMAAQGVIYLELKDEILQLEQAYRLFNVGQTAWVPSGEPVPLPEGWKAFNAQKSMDGIEWDSAKNGAALRGTIGPGLHDTAFRYQLPTNGSEDLTIDIGLLPNVQAFRVIAEAAKGMSLEVDGFPPPQTSQNQEGTHVLFTEKQTPRMDPSFRSVRIHVTGLPTRGNGRVVATALAALGVLAGAFVARKMPPKKGADPDELEEAKRKLLAELDGLEAARSAGEIGPKTYEAARRELIDALARVLAQTAA
jgi:hypothetical protein